jgi:hypothetical protein
MRTITVVAFSSTLLLAPMLATAQDSAAPAVTAAPPATAAPATAASSGNGGATNLDEIVCKQRPPKTGSRLGGGRECHTVRQWNQWQIDSQNALMHQQQMGNIQMGRGG